VPSTLIYGITGGLIGGLIGRKKQRMPSTEGNNHLWRPFLRDLVAARHFDVGLLIGLSYGIVYGLSYGIVYGCMSILLSVILERSKLSTSSLLLTRWSWQSLWSHFIASGYLRNGLFVGVTYSTGYVLSTEIVHQFHLTQIPITQTDVAANTLVYILNYTLIGILLSIIIEGRQTTIQPAEILVWSWRNLWDNLVNVKRLRNGLLLGLLVGTIIEICDLIRLGPGTSTLELGLNAVPIFGLAYWLLLGLLRGLSNDTVSEPHRIQPNQGIRRSARNSILVGMISGFIGWLICTLSYGLDYTFITALNHDFNYAFERGLYVGKITALNTGLSMGITCGLLCGLLYGGLACIEHYTLRLLLWRSGSTPLDYARFLDYAYERVFLRKIGGGYIFIHRLLLEHFASLE